MPSTVPGAQLPPLKAFKGHEVVFEASRVGYHLLLYGRTLNGHLAASGHRKVTDAAFELDVPERAGTQ